MSELESQSEKNTIRELSKAERRVLGVLMEKAFTTPEQYPLTLKALTTGCNQKSNRDPVTNYSESQIADTIDGLRERGLAAEVFTEGGRTSRFRHYMRHCFDFTEPQFAIIAELLLRGRQQPGELRTRARRMVNIPDMNLLKEALGDLQEKRFVQTNGPLERRGVEVDHAYYPPSERQDTGWLRQENAPEPQADVPAAQPAPTPDPGPVIDQLTQAVADLQAKIAVLSERIEAQEEELQQLKTALGS